MEKEFYYLDETEQKGPLSIEQLRTVGLKPDTLVWADGFENWKPVKEVEDLKGLLKKTPPPPPIIDNSLNSTIQSEDESEEERKLLLEDSNVKFWASFKIYSISFLLIGAAALTAYFVSNNKKQKLKQEIYSKVENILDGKTVVLDGTNSLTRGELKETGYTKSKNKSDAIGLLLQEWWEREGLYSVYEASGGGFTILQLTKQSDDGYDVVTYSSGDMGYKKTSGRYVAPEYMDFGYGERTQVGGGYYQNNYRLPVRDCYREAFDFFTKDDKYSTGAYTPGKYVDISNFSDIRNDYFYMSNTNLKTSAISGTTWSTDEHTANVNTEDWAVYYSAYGKHYEITENDTAINSDLLTYLGISVGTIILLLLIGLFSKPKYFRNLYLFGKRWKNISYQEQIFFFEHSFFGKHSFIEIINDKVSRGIIKFTDKGNTINLSYPNKELFYKIEKISKDDLLLVSIKDKSNITFKRVGAKENDIKIDIANSEEVKLDEQSEESNN
jgi:hypothetical protein